MDSNDYFDEKYQIKSPVDAANLVMMEMAFLDHEQMRTQVPVPISMRKDQWGLVIGHRLLILPNVAG